MGTAEEAGKSAGFGAGSGPELDTSKEAGKCVGSVPGVPVVGSTTEIVMCYGAWQVQDLLTLKNSNSRS